MNSPTTFNPKNLSIVRKEIDQELSIVTNPLLEVDIEFGEAGKDCSGLGICRIVERSIYSNLLVIKCNRVPALMKRFSLYRHRFFLQIGKTDLCDEIVAKHLSNYLFHVGESYEIPEVIRFKLDLHKKIVKEGYYLVLESDDDYKILF